MMNGPDEDPSDDARAEEDRKMAERRAVLIKYAKWTPPAMITLLLSSRPSAASQQRPPAPGGF